MLAFLQHSPVKRYGRMAVLQQILPGYPREDRQQWPKMKDPSGGTTGRVKAIWALGVDGRSRRI
jgi:hypothetical protein